MFNFRETSIKLIDTAQGMSNIGLKKFRMKGQWMEFARFNWFMRHLLPILKRGFGNRKINSIYINVNYIIQLLYPKWHLYICKLQSTGITCKLALNYSQIPKKYSIWKSYLIAVKTVALRYCHTFHTHSLKAIIKCALPYILL